MLCVTQDELANLVCVYSRAQLEMWLRRDAIPPYVALQFLFLENAFMQIKHGAIAVPPLPLHLILK